MILILHVRQVISLVTSHPYLPFCRHIIPILNFISIEIFLGVISFSRPKTLNFYCTFFVCLLCSFICLQAVYQLSGPVCKSTWRYFASYSASLISCPLEKL